MTQEREERMKEINNSTPENPVRLTHEEVGEFHEANKTWLQHSVGTGRFLLPVAEGSPAAKAIALKAEGMTEIEIAEQLGFSEAAIVRVLRTAS